MEICEVSLIPKFSTTMKNDKLKKAIIDYWPGKCKKWNKFLSENKSDKNWIETQGLKILLEYHVFCILLEDNNHGGFYSVYYHFITPSSVASNQGELINFWRNPFNHASPKFNYKLCENLCEFMEKVMSKYKDVWHPEYKILIFDHLVEIISFSDESSYMKTVKLAILMVEKLIEEIEIDITRKSKLVRSLSGYTEYLDTGQIWNFDHLEHFDPLLYQIGWCAQWCIDNFLGDQIEIKHLPLIKLSHDQFEARNDSDKCITIRSSFLASSGSYFFEVYILNFFVVKNIYITDGIIRVGWTTKESMFESMNNKNYAIGNDKHSISFGFDKTKNYFWHEEKEESQIVERQSVSWRKGDDNIEIKLSQTKLENLLVIGCLIDLDNQKIVFYLNGQQIEYKTKVHFSSSPYCAAVSFSNDQQCYCNFGQKPFKYSPTGIEFSTFHGDCDGDERRYHLAELNVTQNGLVWHRNSLINNQFELFYSEKNQLQEELNKLVKQIAANPRTVTFKLKRKNLFWFIQAVIENTQEELKFDNELLKNLRKKLIKLNENNLAQICEFFYPYVNLPVNKTIITKCHNICMVFLEIVKIFPNLSKEFSLQSFYSLLLKKFINNMVAVIDPVVIIECLTRLDYIQFNKNELHHLVKDQTIMSTLWWCAEQFYQFYNVDNHHSTSPTFNFLRFQAGFCAKWFLDNVLQCTEIKSSQATLNVQTNKTQHLKLSSDKLSARSDLNWQTVRFCFEKKTILYEVILITDGPMRIGWSTLNSNLDKDFLVGNDECSIGFDGHNNYIYHNCKPYPQSTSQWKIGDVVGCLIDLNKNKFKFYLNGNQVKYFFSKEFQFNLDLDGHYYASVSLSANQQCYFNFGKPMFKYSSYFNSEFYFYENNSTCVKTLTQMKPYSKMDSFQFKQVLIKKKIESFFKDSRQKEFNKLALDFHFDKSRNLYKEKHCLRMIQSFIEISENNFKDKIAEMAFEMSQFIENSSKKHILFLDIICKMLYSYFPFHFTFDTINTHLGVCIVLSSLIPLMNDLKKRINLYEQIFTYLVQIVVQNYSTNNRWIFVFAFSALENLDIDQEHVKQIQESENMYEILNQRHTADKSWGNLQFSFCLQWFHDFIFVPPKLNNECCEEFDSATLNYKDKTNRLKLSSDWLLARSDSLWQSVRSVGSVSSDLSDTVYFEVLLHTSGPMKIGWATEQTDLKNNIGFDKNSISFDGYSRIIWHGNISYHVTNVDQWKAGDVIGCLINFPKRKFLFNLNGKNVSYKATDIHFCTNEAYFVAVSLSSYQQCSFNFGQTPFKNQSNKKPYKNLYTLSLNCKNNLLQKSKNLNETILPTSTELVIFSHEWTIENFTNMFNDSFLSVIYSNKFPSEKNIPLNFSLRLLPSFIDENNEDAYLSIFLFAEQSKLFECKNKLSAKYFISIIDSNGQHLHGKGNKSIFSQGDCFGWIDFYKFSLSKLVNLPKNKLVILCEIEIEDDASKIIIENYGNMNGRLSTKNFFDCNIKVNHISDFWEIENFSSFFYNASECPTGTYKQSHIFQNSDHGNKYFLKLWPQGIDEASKEYVSIYLYREPSAKDEIYIQFRISAVDWQRNAFKCGEGRGQLHSYEEIGDFAIGIGSSRFMPLEQILNRKNGLLSADKLTLFCEIEEVTKK